MARLTPGKAAPTFLSAHPEPQQQLPSLLGRTFPTLGQLVFVESLRRRRREGKLDSQPWGEELGFGTRPLLAGEAFLLLPGQDSAMQEVFKLDSEPAAQGWGDERSLWLNLRWPVS